MVTIFAIHGRHFRKYLNTENPFRKSEAFVSCLILCFFHSCLDIRTLDMEYDLDIQTDPSSDIKLLGY